MIKISRVKNNFVGRFTVMNLSISILFLQIISFIPAYNHSLFADEPQSCEQKLDLAEENYYEGNLDETIRLVKECIADPELKQEERLRAYKILSRTLLKNENIIATKEIINKIFDLDPIYQPTIEEETPQLVNLVNEVRQDRLKKRVLSEEKGADKSWLWYVAGGAAVVGAVVLIAGGTNENKPTEEEEPLPEPPVFP